MKPVLFFSWVTYDKKWMPSCGLLGCHTLYCECREISQSSFGVKFFASVISSGTSPTFLSQPLSSFIDTFASTKFLWPNTWSPWPNVASTSPGSAISQVCSMQISLPGSLVVSLLNVYLCELIPCFDCWLLWKVTWYYHWETRRQHSHTLCCLWVYSTQMHRGKSLSMRMGPDGSCWREGRCISFSHSASWAEELAVKFVFDTTNHSSCIMVPQNWIMLLGDWCSLTKTW